MDELIAFVRRCLDEDERKVAAMEREETRVRTAPIFQGHPLGWLAGVDIFVSSKRWRAEIEAKRRILEMYADAVDRVRNPVSVESRTAARVAQFELEQVFTAFAQPYVGQDGWREEWAL
jgi:hypothetical protein